MAGAGALSGDDVILFYKEVADEHGGGLAIASLFIRGISTHHEDWGEIAQAASCHSDTDDFCMS